MLKDVAVARHSKCKQKEPGEQHPETREPTHIATERTSKTQRELAKQTTNRKNPVSQQDDENIAKPILLLFKNMLLHISYIFGLINDLKWFINILQLLFTVIHWNQYLLIALGF